MARDREFDLVLLGATGFTGGLTARYLAEHAPQDLRWALAGRNEAKLRALGIDVPLLHADSSDRASLDALAARTGLVISTVGPYLEHGGPLVAACAAAGTDYVDLTGEPEFVDQMYVDHHATAVSTGARIVHACGFDSIPHDIGAFFTMQQLGTITDTVHLRGVVRSNAALSGGTFHSALGQFSHLRGMKAAAQARRRIEPHNRRAASDHALIGRDPILGYWLVPLPTIDQSIVVRSGRALESYGPRFRYAHFAGTKTLRYAVGGAAGAAALVAAAQVPPLRDALGRRLPQGQGPSEKRRAHSWFTVDFVVEHHGETHHTRVSGGDPGYSETAKMLAEAAMCLVLDDNPDVAGSVTTAQAMGENLLQRLIAAGIKFDVIS